MDGRIWFNTFERIGWNRSICCTESSGITITWIVPAGRRNSKCSITSQYGESAPQFSNPSTVHQFAIDIEVSLPQMRCNHQKLTNMFRITLQSSNACQAALPESKVVYAFKHLQNIKRGGLDRIDCSFPMNFPFSGHFPCIFYPSLPICLDVLGCSKCGSSWHFIMACSSSWHFRFKALICFNGLRFADSAPNSSRCSPLHDFGCAL